MKITTPEWVKDAVFYQIFPDRFATSKRVDKKGLKLEAWGAPPSVFGFKGGDLRGVTEHLDYLRDLGITALYFCPVFASGSNHRYHTFDYYHVDPLLGGNKALRELLDKAHKRGIKVVLDGVFNHASRGFWQFHHVLENGAGSPYVDWFHFNPDFLNGKKRWGAYPTKTQQAQLNKGAGSYETLGFKSWWNNPALPKLNTDTPAVREFIFDVAEYWLKFGIDGWRLDVPEEIDDDSFWQEFRRRVKKINPEAYIVGEIWHESRRWLQGDQFDAVMNYLFTAAVMGFVMGDQMSDEAYRAGGYRDFLKPLDAPGFADRIDDILSFYDPAINHVQLNLLDSHDTPRYLTIADNDKTALTLGWFYLMTYPGAPCIYYGDEIGLDGHHDPDCRKSFPWQNKKSWDNDLRKYLKELIKLREKHAVLRRGTYQNLYAENDVVAYARVLGKKKYILGMNVSSEPRTVSFPASALELADGKLKTILGKTKASVRRDVVTMIIPERSGVAFKA